uniref:PWWP domain-containing protein n=1 Tax=Moschus moschiferus TaxID=68415 RepID=A0A8C6D2B2_MOSMO
MMDAKYVLCIWKGCFWPAKILSRPSVSPQQKRKKALSLEVQILSVDEKIRVKSINIKTLNESMIESLTASLAAQPEPSGPEEEEMVYICTITMAWDLLNKNGSYTPARVTGDPESKMLSPRKLQKQHRRRCWEPNWAYGGV